jgi:hypothetical protein
MNNFILFFSFDSTRISIGKGKWSGLLGLVVGWADTGGGITVTKFAALRFAYEWNEYATRLSVCTQSIRPWY